MTRQKIKSTSLCCAILVLIWLQQRENQWGEMGKIRDEIPPTEWRLNGALVSCVSPLCILSTCDCCLSSLEAPAESLNLILCDPVIVIRIACRCLCCDVVPVTFPGSTRGKERHSVNAFIAFEVSHILVHGWNIYFMIFSFSFACFWMGGMTNMNLFTFYWVILCN